MRVMRTAFMMFLLMSFLPISAAWAAGPGNPAEGDDVYDRLKAGVKIAQAREYEVADQPTVYLTFDDGPGKLTGKVLDLLKEEGVPATFFVLGEYVKRYPDAIRRMVEEGHSIGNHTYNHQYNHLYPDFRLFWNQVQLTDAALQETAGVNTNLIRAPGGTFSHFDAFFFYYLDQAGYTVFDWNVDSGDALRANVPMAEIVRNVKSTPLKQEMVVLMHDGSGHDESVRALPEVIRFYKEQGYKFAPLSDRVKPIQSNLDRSKKAQSLSREEHGNWLLTMQEAARGKAGRGQSPGSDGQGTAILPDTAMMSAIAEPAEPAAPPLPVPPLRVRLGQGIWELPPAEYAFKDERLFVPLRELVERMGGTVTWDDISKTASVSYGLYGMVVDLPHRSLSVQTPGRGEQVVNMADVSLRDGKLVVPLRKAVEMLGGKVATYSLQDSLREVTVDTSENGYGLVRIPKWLARV